MIFCAVEVLSIWRASQGAICLSPSHLLRDLLVLHDQHREANGSRMLLTLIRGLAFWAWLEDWLQIRVVWALSQSFLIHYTISDTHNHKEKAVTVCTVTTRLYNQLWDWAKSGCIMDQLPDWVSHNTEGKIQDLEKMVIIKGWSLDWLGRYTDFDCT